MAVSTLKPSGGVNDFNLSLTGATTSATLDREYATGSYSVTSSSLDTTLDLYAYNADGSLAGYSATKSFTATKGFNKMVIMGGTTGDVLSFTYKKTYVTAAQTAEVTAGPFIISTSPSSLPNANDVVTITGGNFATDVEVHFIGQNSVVYDAKSITRTSATNLQVTRPDVLSVAHSPYTIRVINPGVPNPSGSLVNVASNAVNVGSSTSWVTNSPLPAFSVGFSYSTTVVATDPDNSTITYSLASGSFPTGISLSESGVISGTNTDVTTEGQTFTAVVRATDAGNNFTDRSFTMQANLRPSWTTLAGDLTSANKDQAYSFQLVASTESVGGTLTYALQSGSLLTGLSLSSSGLISGTNTTAIGTTSTFTVRVTDSLGAYTDRQFNIFSDAAGQQLFTSSTSWTVPANVTSVSVVAVGGGGGGSASTTAAGGFSGGGGAGGALHWRNAISVTAGETLSIGIGAAGTGGTAAGSNNATAGGESFVKRSTTYLVQAPGGEAGKYNLNNTSLGGVPNTALGGGGGTGGRGGNGANGQGVGQPWTWNGTTATATLAYTGGVQSLTFPTSAVVTFDAVGGAGVSSTQGAARVQGTFTASAGTYNFRIGGAGSGTSGGYNGGGNGGSGGRYSGGGGGGATDIRAASDDTLNGRIVVAAGSGGPGGAGGQGGGGGYTNGSSGVNGQGQGGTGGSQTAGGSGGSPNGGTSGSAGGFGTAGNGGSSSTDAGGGGGAGYYGGGGGGADVDACCSGAGGGGGGSSYTSGAVSNVTHTANFRTTGNGSLTVSYATTTNPNTPDAYPSGGGGGAAGYSGNGGDGSLNATYVATAGTGGGGSGSTGHNNGPETIATGGGGVGLLGEGTSGAAPNAVPATAGNPGSGGTGKTYGAGGAGADDDSTLGGGTGGAGAVRIIWGFGRQFPATQTGDK